MGKERAFINSSVKSRMVDNSMCSARCASESARARSVLETRVSLAPSCAALPIEWIWLSGIFGSNQMANALSFFM